MNDFVDNNIDVEHHYTKKASLTTLFMHQIYILLLVYPKLYHFQHHKQEQPVQIPAKIEKIQNEKTRRKMLLPEKQHIQGRYFTTWQSSRSSEREMEEPRETFPKNEHRSCCATRENWLITICCNFSAKLSSIKTITPKKENHFFFLNCPR